MNVMFVSQCDKRALTETRRLLDQFAERRGDRTWLTPITQDGLQTLHRMLRKTARKNTAVACHWVRGAGQTELLWVVGDKRQFNTRGAVPTNTTKRNVLRQQDENSWRHGQLIVDLTDLAGLLHDLGKATKAFQQRLQGKRQERNLIRHEWSSLRLFQAFVGSDDDAIWLARLANPSAQDDARWLKNLHRDGIDGIPLSPFKELAAAPLAQALGWLVATHHRLPQPPWMRSQGQPPQPPQFQMTSLRGLIMQVQADWNEDNFRNATPSTLTAYWCFDEGLPISTKAWRQRASRVARRLLTWHSSQPTVPSSATVLGNPFVMHLSRLCLMLADHHYSSLENTDPDIAQRVALTPNYPLLANTRRRDGGPNQTLDEHLLGVAQHGAEIARFLPRFDQYLPRLVQHKRLKQRAQSERYRWQDKAAELAQSMRERTQQHGGFVVNMASTGCGKTLGNARIMYALADPLLGMRCAFAMGLRTLTLQTGKAFRDLIGLNDDELATRVGGSASRSLFEYHEAVAEACGSASRQALDEEDAHVAYEGDIDAHPLLRRAVTDSEVRKLLMAPLLVCTIDHLTPATESQRGGRQIAPMLRLMSGDLVLDEPDDFDLADLPALTRLVHWAGLLGARVLLSSATLPPALVQGLFDAYQNGRHHFHRNCSPSGIEVPSAVCCAWVDEFHQTAQECPTSADFEQAHAIFVARRHAELTKLATHPRRRAALLPLVGPENAQPKDLQALAATVAPQIMVAALALHREHHSLDPHGDANRRVSFGLVRMANIEPLFEVALALYQQILPTGVQVHLCVYHSRHPLLVRSAIEQQLDNALKRHNTHAVFQLPGIRARLDSSAQADHLFIVLGSPVTEVGRDHDYDWALVEPSSMRSLIQLAGRVRRHRPEPVSTPNIRVFSRNLRSFTAPNHASFCKPGFEAEDGHFRLHSHDLNTLLTPEELVAVDARPRITASASLAQQDRLTDLEHARLRDQMLPRTQTSQRQLGSRARATPVNAPPPALNASTWWQQAPEDALLTAVLPQQQPFRKALQPNDIELVLLPDEDQEKALLHQLMDGKNSQLPLYLLADADRCQHLPDSAVEGDRISPWGVTDYMSELTTLASALDISVYQCAQRFGKVSIQPNANGWRYHPALGFSKAR
jgi:CRISPR-associated endonuclease/helicase Cas3